MPGIFDTGIFDVGIFDHFEASGGNWKRAEVFYRPLPEVVGRSRCVFEVGGEARGDVSGQNANQRQWLVLQAMTSE